MPRSEAETRRELIDPRLQAAGWVVQDRASMSLYAGRGVAVREFPLETGYADYQLFFDRKPASETPWTKTLWIYDLRTNQNFTLKTRTLARQDLDEFVACYNPANRFERCPAWSEDNPAGRWRAFSYEELMGRDKANLNIFWLRDELLEDSANLPEPDVLAQEIADDLEAAPGADPGDFERVGREMNSSIFKSLSYFSWLTSSIYSLACLQTPASCPETFGQSRGFPLSFAA